MFFAGARDALERLVTPTFVLELNVARLRGTLRGTSPEARYKEYGSRLTDPAYVAALEAEYGVLFDLADERLASWRKVSLELIERLCAGWEAIRVMFFGDQTPGLLSGIEVAQRTTKRGGRAVLILTFSSGAKLVYKPRSLAVEDHFQQLLAWLNDRGFTPAFQTIDLLNRDTHGWLAWVEAAGCASNAAVERFYQRQGAYLALLYALEATDFHLGNVIAAGEHPMLIDLEALFHPRAADPDWPALDLALDSLTYDSVLGVGLLPEPEAVDNDGLRFDLGGLTGAPGQATPYTIPRWNERGTDTMHQVHERQLLSGGGNRPTLHGRPADVLDYLPAFEAGFCAAYRLLVEHRPALLADDGPLSRFAGDEVRVLLRSGLLYSELLESSYHPDLLRREGARRAYLEQKLAGATSDPSLEGLIPLETAALLAGDAPVFTTTAGSTAIHSYEWHRAPVTFPQPGLTMSRRRIESMGETDLARQRTLMWAAFSTVAPDDAGRSQVIDIPDFAPGDLAAQLLAQAVKIAARLAASAVWAGDEASWIGVELDSDGQWALEPLDIDLYNGLPGVALFLTTLAAQNGQSRWNTLARATLVTHCRLAHEARAAGPDALAPLGLFDGLGGQLLALARLHALLGEEPMLRDEMAALVEDARLALSDSPTEETPDLARGVAGCLAGLLEAHAAAPALNVLPVARMAGEALWQALRTSQAGDDGPNDRHSPFAAYFDTAAGAAAPLLELATLTGNTSLRRRPEALIASLLPAADIDAGHWLAFLSARPWLAAKDRAALDSALLAALPGLVASGPDNHSLGRGRVGYLELLLNAAEALDEPAFHELAARHAAALLDDLRRRGPRTGVPLGFESPGLLAGLSGIGYGLLRLATPEVVPPILLPIRLWRAA